ncbi:Cysteine desulfurase [Hydrogenobacter thermophilus TK-6]|uniref:FeS cluster formation protein n=1 Tax=Hydrogenobacter thermophilus (strain DSM 6534 / IAM 12695 / TK-6) TaxID=608538 RepID=D3DIF9_HYDTT|nr:cysteine desulfurase family protein [Hydrogenobacter thermophilus]ADO45537.1 Cysteine desulfurase [Hydrogenobacter thermophilus TK-6]BAI69611.1 FeS cluster formation protein [Hydrogenobacter thermophilus TK-6]
MFIKKVGQRVVYLDHIATTPVAQEVLEAMLPYFREHFGNPTSLHSFGQVTKKAINSAREKIATLINANSPEEIVFTSGGIEANNLAIKGIAEAYEKKGRHIVSTEIEHHSVLHPLKTLERKGWEVTYLKPDRYGLIHPDQVSEAVRTDTVLVSIGHSNREIGTVQDIKSLVQAAKSKNPKVIFHTDAAPTLGHYPVDVKDWGVDAASFTAHLMYGPKGVGALWTRKGVKIRPLIEGGTQERGVRAGTENVPGIVGFGAAAELTMKELQDRMTRLSHYRDKLRKALEERLDYIEFTGHPTQRLPHHLSLIVHLIEGEAMLLRLDLMGIETASGSACVSLALKQSHVLFAVGVPKEVANGSLVFSFGRDNTEEDVDYVIEEFPKIIKLLRQISPFTPENWEQYVKSKK